MSRSESHRPSLIFLTFEMTGLVRLRYFYLSDSRPASLRLPSPAMGMAEEYCFGSFLLTL